MDSYLYITHQLAAYSVTAPELSQCQYKYSYMQGEPSVHNSSAGCSVTAPELSQYRYKFRYLQSPLCTLLIDSGYSFTHIVPYCKGKKLRDAVCRSGAVLYCLKIPPYFDLMSIFFLEIESCSYKVDHCSVCKEKMYTGHSFNTVPTLPMN